MDILESLVELFVDLATLFIEVTFVFVELAIESILLVVSAILALALVPIWLVRRLRGGSKVSLGNFIRQARPSMAVRGLRRSKPD